MHLLSIETCFGEFSVALHSGEEELGFYKSAEKHSQAEFLIPEIQQMLTDNELSFEDLDAIACNIGPGSFTGLRIGLAAANGFALASEIGLVGVNSLEAAAAEYGLDEIYLDAKRGEAYHMASGSEPELVAYQGEFAELPSARGVAKAALAKLKTGGDLQNRLEPLYIRQSDAKTIEERKSAK